MTTRLGMVRPGVVMPRRLDYESKLLFHFRAADLLLGNDPSEDIGRAMTGEDPAAFTRASAGGYTRDAFGFLTQWGQGTPRIEMYDLNDDGYWETPGIMLEGQRENVCLRSQEIDHGAWSSSGTPVVTANDAEAPDRTTTADKIEDDDAGLNESRLQTVVIANDSTDWCASVFVKKAAAGAPVCMLRLGLDGGAPTLNARTFLDPITGDILVGADAVDGGVIEYATYWRLWVRVANNSNGNVSGKPYLYPAVRETGDLGADSPLAATLGSNHFWGVQLENAAFPSTYIPTVGSAVTRIADALTYTLAWLGQTITEDLDDVTVYARMARPLHADVTGSLGLNARQFKLSSTVPTLDVFFNDTSRLVFGNLDTAGTDGLVSQSMPSGAVIESTAQFRNLRTGGSVAVDVGSGLSAFSSPAATAFSAYGDATLDLNKTPNGEIFGALFEIKFARGLRTMTQMQEAF